MEITKADVNAFKTLYRKKFGIELDKSTAQRKLSHLVRQMELIYQPIKKAQVEKLNKADGDDNGKLTSTN